jgi:uncharacterized protein (DUF1330 family)
MIMVGSLQAISDTQPPPIVWRPTALDSQRLMQPTRIKPVPAYLVVQVQIRDAEIYKQYAARSPAIIAKHGGRFLARGGETDVLEGDTPQRRVVIIEFPSRQAARDFYHSREYQEIKEIRTPVSDGLFLVVDGVE